MQTRRTLLQVVIAGAGQTLLAACTGQAAAPAPTAQQAAAAPGALATATRSNTAVPQAAALACVLKPRQTEGPFFVDEKLERSDIRADPTDGSVKAGVPLTLTLRVAQVTGGSCSPLPGAVVDVWHCDSQGVYSDARDQGFNTVGKKFLRGYQVTDQNGAVTFQTIFPGWYQGRAVHIHFKIRTNPASSKGQDFTSQLYFDEALASQVYSRAPYASKGQGFMRNNQDGIFRDGGSQLLVPLSGQGDGYASTFDVGITMT